MQQAAALLALCDPEPDSGAPAPPEAVTAALPALEEAYQALKAALLEAGATGALGMQRMEAGLRRFSVLRRAAEQAAKAARLARASEADGVGADAAA